MVSTATTVLASLHDVPAELCAGVHVVTSVPDRPINGEQLRQLLDANGFDGSLVPQPKKSDEVNAFQNACRSVESKRGSRSSGVKTTVAVGEVVTNQTESVYQITAEVRDEKNLVIEHPKAMRIRYDKAFQGLAAIRVDVLDQAYADQFRELADLVQLRFDASRGRITGAKVREILRFLFRQLHAPRWANGVYHVDLKHTDKVIGLETVLRTIYGADAFVRVSAVFNTAGVRAELALAVEQSVRDDVDGLVGELAKKLKAATAPEPGKAPKKITDKDFERAQAQRAEVLAHAEAMMGDYGQEIAAVKSAIGLIDQQMLAMFAHMSQQEVAA